MEKREISEDIGGTRRQIDTHGVTVTQGRPSRSVAPANGELGQTESGGPC